MARFVQVEGANGAAFFINVDFIKAIKSSHHEGMCRLVSDLPDGTETGVSVRGTLADLAEKLNG